jgi:hypothetical protein
MQCWWIFDFETDYKFTYFAFTVLFSTYLLAALNKVFVLFLYSKILSYKNGN